MTVAELLLARAADDRPGLRADDRVWTWREVVAECAARAQWMLSLAEDRPPHVGVLLDNVPELVFLIGGAALSGSVIVALNTSRSAAELAGDAARADCDLIVTEAAHAELARDLPNTIHRPEPFPNATPPDISGITPETLLMLIFTSGTSGNPRAVRVTHRKVVIPGSNLAGRLLTANDVVYCPMPLFHSGALMAAYAPALAAGATLVLRRRFSVSGLLDDVRHYGCTYLHYVGKALSYALTAPARPGDRDNPLRVAFGNEAAPLEQKAFADRFGCLVIDGYGSTETAIALSPDPFGPPGALGRLAEGIAILNPETGQECPPARFDRDGRIGNGDEAIGELVNTQGLGLFDGYYNDHEADAERIKPVRSETGRPKQGYWSGDYAYADDQGYVFFAGRALDRLRVDGENFGAVQVERVLATFPGLTQHAVYGVPDPAAGDQVMAAVILDGAFDPKEFEAFWQQRRDVSSKWIPRFVRIARTLPATPSNKILKRLLARQAWLTGDPVWWRPDRARHYALMTDDDKARLHDEFARTGRTELLERNG